MLNPIDPSSDRDVAGRHRWPVEFRHGIPPCTQRQLDFRLRRLARAFRLANTDIADVEGMLILELYRALRAFDPGKASATTFAAHALRRAYVRVAKRLRRECRRRRSQRSLDAAGGRVSPVSAGTAGSATSLLDELDLSARDRDLLFDLARMSPAQAARGRGVHRGTIARQLGRVRAQVGAQ